MEWNIIWGPVCTLLGVVITALTFRRGQKKDDQQEGQQTGVILTEIGYIKSSMDSLNHKLDTQEGRMLDVAARLAAVEASAKQAHHRIDRLEKADGSDQR